MSWSSPMTPYESQYTRKRSQGYVQYLGRYMYFDNEGVVVEILKVTTKGNPAGDRGWNLTMWCSMRSFRWRTAVFFRIS